MREYCEDGLIIAVDVSAQGEPVRDWDFDNVISGWRVLGSRINPFAHSKKVPSIGEIALSSLVVNSTYRQQQAGVQADLLISPRNRRGWLTRLRCCPADDRAGLSGGRTGHLPVAAAARLTIVPGCLSASRLVELGAPHANFPLPIDAAYAPCSASRRRHPYTKLAVVRDPERRPARIRRGWCPASAHWHFSSTCLPARFSRKMVGMIIDEQGRPVV